MWPRLQQWVLRFSFIWRSDRPKLWDAVGRYVLAKNIPTTLFITCIHGEAEKMFEGTSYCTCGYAGFEEDVFFSIS